MRIVKVHVLNIHIGIARGDQRGQLEVRASCKGLQFAAGYLRGGRVFIAANGPEMYASILRNADQAFYVSFFQHPVQPIAVEYGFPAFILDGRHRVDARRNGFPCRFGCRISHRRRCAAQQQSSQQEYKHSLHHRLLPFLGCRSFMQFFSHSRIFHGFIFTLSHQARFVNDFSVLCYICPARFPLPCAMEACIIKNGKISFPLLNPLSKEVHHD